MKPTLVRKLIYPLHEQIMRRPTFANLRKLEDSQWWDHNQLRDLQTLKLSCLLQHAQRHSPYFNGVFKEHRVDPQKQDPWNCLQNLPLLDKKTIRNHRSEMTWHKPPGGLVEAMTGGSTGEPLRFYFDKRRQAFDKAARMRTHRWFGVNVGDREVYLWGSPHEANAYDRVKSMRDRLTNEVLLSAFHLTPARMDAYFNRIEQFDPSSIFGYPSSLFLLCDYGNTTGRRLSPGSLKAVFTTGEMLDEVQRRVIQEHFRVPVADGYGSREAGFIAHDCPQGGKHVTDENVIVEIIDPKGHPVDTGCSGEIVITHLDAWAMPMIRYRTGDIGRHLTHACGCGRGLSRMRIVGGRHTDHLIGQDGRRMHGLGLIYILREMPNVQQFQIRQEESGRIRVQIVPSTKFGNTDRIHIIHGIRGRLGKETAVTIETVQTIQSSPSGKFRCVTSDFDASEPETAVPPVGDRASRPC